MSTENKKTIRFEICESTFWILLAAIIGLTIVGFTGVLSHYYTQRLNAAFAAGYEEGVLPGSSQVNWVKHKQ